MKDTITVFIVLGAISRFARFGLVSAYYSLYLKHAGLDLLEINMVNVCYYVAIFLCEIPTGAFADVYGRKRAFVVAHCIGSLSMFLYGVSSHFWQFAYAEIITAIGVTFSSGAFEAWLVDTLKHEGNTTPLQKVFGRNEYWKQGSVLLGSLTGSLIAEYDMRVPWMIGGVGELLVAFFAVRVDARVAILDFP
jgi:MFS family permease